jgi:oxygen-dependent protoporphyrinogen oxidase
MGIDVEPDFVRIFRHRQAIPQYTVGHGKRLLALDDCLGGTPGLFLTGNAFFGVGLNDCVNSSNQTAARVVAFVKGNK